jgi:hypothetical protein
MDWRTSTYSNANGGQCVEVSSAEGVMVRDTVNRDGFALSVPADAWRALLLSLKRA